MSATQLARGWFNAQVQTASWASAGPFTIEQVDTRTKSGQRKIRVDYRAGDGRLIGTLGVLWDDRTGWRVGGSRACAGPADGTTPATVPTDPGLVIYRGMFSPRAGHSSLDCSGANGGGAIFDRGSEPPANPQTVEQHAAKWEADQSNRANPRWDEAAPPRRWYYYPRDPAIAARAGVDWVDAHGRVVMSLGLSRYDGGPAWHVGSWASCVGGAGVV